MAACMQGRIIASRLEGSFATVVTDNARAPVQDAVYRYESTSRVTATVRTQSGTPVVMVLTRNGLHWRLSDVRLAP